MPYYMMSMPTILFQALEHNSEGIEYHVKSTDPEVTQCPSQSCQTLAEYLEKNLGTTLPMLKLCFHARTSQSTSVTYSLSGLHST